MYQTADDCDSLVTLNLTINSSSTGTSSATACDSYTWDGVTYTTSGTYSGAYSVPILIPIVIYGMACDSNTYTNT